MKVVFAILVFVSTFAFAGERKSKETLFGDKYFEVEDYYLASEHYKLALENDPSNLYIEFQLAECERFFADYEKAQVMYFKVMNQDEATYPLSRFYYAYMQKVNGDYLGAEENFEVFLSAQRDSLIVDSAYLELAQLHYDGCVMALEEMQKPYRHYGFYDLGKPVNSVESDFAPALFYSDTMLVVSSARFTEEHDEIDGRLGGGFLDNYVFVKGETGWEESPSSSEIKRLNTQYHEGSSFFNKDKNQFYYTRCDEPMKHKEGFNCVIYVSDYNGEGWDDGVKLNENINPKGTYNAQPSLSPNEDTLYFVSKRDGGKGMNDIWYSVLNESRKWGEAINLEAVNTPYMEVSPSYYGKDDVLFFSSNGHESFGGLDMYMARGLNKDNIENVGLPFNSNKDDFYMVLGDSIGYITSNRDGGLGHDDLYAYDVYYEQTLLVEVNADSVPDAEVIDVLGKIIETHTSPVHNLRVFVLDEDGNVVMETKTEDDGSFVLEGLKAEGIYKIILDEKGSITREADYKLDDIRVIGHSSQPIADIDEDTKAISISGKLLDDDGNPLVGVEVVLFDAETGEELKTTTTDENGEFVFSNLDPSKTYKVMVRDDDGNLIEYDYKNKKVQVTQHKEDENNTSLDLAKSGQVSRVHFKSIYFDFDSDKLRLDSKEVLDELIAFVKPHDHLKIEINGNTDAIGSKDYNLDLGKRRGVHAYNYLVEKGLDKSDIVVNSVGEDNPVADNTSEEGRQLNRRVEFLVVGGGAYKVPEGYTVERTGANTYESKDNGSSETTQDEHKALSVRNTGDTDMDTDHLVELEAPAKREVVAEQSEVNGVVYGVDDGSGYYVVLPKNTLYSLSIKFNTTVDQIKVWNDLKSNTIIIGQILRVKETVTKKVDVNDKTALADMGISVKEHQGEVVLIGGKQRYVVKHGDTFYAIAKRFHLTTTKLKELNKLDSYMLYSGMVLRVE